MSLQHRIATRRTRQQAPQVDPQWAPELFTALARATRAREYGRAKVLMAELRRAGWSVVYLGDAREGRR